MFNKLVVSTLDRRKPRIAKFFLGTSIIYLGAVSAAFAVSVLISNPKLADSGIRLSTLVAPVPRSPDPPSPNSGPRPGGAPPQDPYHVVDLDGIQRNAGAQPTTAPPFRIVPPGIGSIDPSRGDFGGPGGGPSGGGDALLGPGEGRVEPPPPPVHRDPPPERVQNQQPLKLISSVLQGKAIERRTPAYPPLAKATRVGGSVSVEVVISPEGVVESARAVGGGHPLLIRAAEEAARGWRFQSTKLNGTAVRVTGVITFVFRLDN